MRSTEERLAGYEEDLFAVREHLAKTQVAALERVDSVDFVGTGGTWESGKQSETACLYKNIPFHPET